MLQSNSKDENSHLRWEFFSSRFAPTWLDTKTTFFSLWVDFKALGCPLTMVFARADERSPLPLQLEDGSSLEAILPPVHQEGVIFSSPAWRVLGKALHF